MSDPSPEPIVYGWRLAIMAFALVTSFFFSAIEFAVIRLDRLALREEAEDGNNKAAKTLLRFLEDPGKFLSCISIGNTLANLLLSSFVAVTFADPLARWSNRVLFGGAGDFRSVESATTAVVTFLLTFVVLVCGEITPKQFALAKGPTFAHRMAGPIRGWSFVVAPFVFLVNVSAKGLLRLFGIRASLSQTEHVDEDQILRQVEYGEQSGAIESDEKEMIENVFELNDLTAEDVMVHRKDMVALPSTVTAAEVQKTIRETGFSRIPIYTESVDNIIGVLNSRDLLLASLGGQTPEIAPLLRKAMFVPETVRADVLLKRMQKRKQTVAIVVDDHGGTSGIVSIEDLVEQIVGDLYDEYDKDSEILRIARLPDGRWRIPGEMTIDEVNDALDAELEEGEYNTLGGYIIEKLTTVPTEGARVRVPDSDLELKVEKMDGHRIDSVLAQKIS